MSFRVFAVVVLVLSCPLVMAMSGDTSDFCITVDNSFSEQNNPAVAVGLGGKFAVIWADYRNGNADIYGQLFDSGGTTSGDNFIVNDDDISAVQSNPDISSDWYGNYFCVWTDYRNSSYPFNPDIYYQKLNATGVVGSNRNITIERPDSSHQSPAVAAAGWGKTVVAWTDVRNWNWDVFTQALDNNGNLVGVNKKVNDDDSDTPQHEPKIGLSPSGWYVVVWYDGRNGNDDIYIQKFDSAGNKIGSNILVNDDNGTTKQKFPSVAVGGNGTIYVVWTDWRYGSYPVNPDIWGQRYDSNIVRIGKNFRISNDGSSGTQRDPQVAADRMGNACVVWADSTAKGWNVVGQMYDSDNHLIDANFQVNTVDSGKQLVPDVAMDGYNLYLVWADNRNGNYDIYGRVIKYNEPALLTEPLRIDLSMDKHDPDPESIKVIISNAGYGELQYRLQSQQTWISLSKTTGLTPDSFYVQLSAAELEYGMHQGSIKLIDMTHGDSTGTLPVMLSITGALIDIQPDSLNFNALEEMGPPANKNIVISNSGSGSLNWTAITTADWIQIDKTEGSEEEVISVGCDLSGLISGDYTGYIIVSDTAALNSPESLQVNLKLISNIPYLSAEPDSIYYLVMQGTAIHDSLRILNLGGSSSSWQASISADWFVFAPTSGTDNSVITYDIETYAMSPGRYQDSLLISDTMAFNNPYYVPLTIDISTADTIIVWPAQAELGQAAQVSVYLSNAAPVQEGHLKFSYVSSLLAIDSLRPPMSGDMVGRITAAVDTEENSFLLEILPDSGGLPLNAGQHYLGDICITANDSVTGITRLQAVSDSEFFLRSAAGFDYCPVLKSNDIEIGNYSSVDDPQEGNIPFRFSLEQNTPNPFNGNTLIRFFLERSDPVKVAVYNILGQRVSHLQDGYLEAGEHTVSWDGLDEAGHGCGSGIYLYRLETSRNTAVKKMLYLK